MRKIFDAKQTRQIDARTIDQQQIDSFALMQRAAQALFQQIIKDLPIDIPVKIVAGNGNNGGDAFVVAQLLHQAQYRVEVYWIGDEAKTTPDCRQAKDKLSQYITPNKIESTADIPIFKRDDYLLDGLLGIGVNRPVEGLLAQLIEEMNQSGATIYSIDMPSGLYTDNNESNNLQSVVHADTVFTIQNPKLSLLLPQEQAVYRRMEIVDIGLSESVMDALPTHYYYIEQEDIRKLIRKREVFSHKGSYGHALIISGSYGKMGASVLAARACLRAGVGLLTMHVPRCGLEILQITVSEAMVTVDTHTDYVTELGKADLTKYTIGIGPSIGQEDETKALLYKLFDSTNNRPMVIDADALNLIASDDSLRKKIPQGSILTPHPIEFERLIAMKCKSAYQRLRMAQDYAAANQLYIVLKGAYSAIVTPESEVYFNSTGNPGMSTGGMGDTLTGIITSLLAQKYSSFHAALIGVYLHGLAGDLCADKISEQSLLPSDLINYIGKSFLSLKE